MELTGSESTEKGVPAGEVQFPINHQLLEEATRLKEERRMLRERLEKIEATRADVSTSVYERVRADYQRRYDESHAALLTKKQEVDRELATLQETGQRIGGNLASHKEVLEEIQLRHSLGEFAEQEYQDRAQQAAEKIRKFEKLLAAVRSNIQSYETLFASEADFVALPAKTATSPPPAKKPVEQPLTTVLTEQSTSEAALEPDDEEYLLEEEAGDYFEAEKGTVSAPSATDTSRHAVGASAAAVTGPTLTIVRGDNSGKVFAVQKEATIGRASNNVVVLKEAKISRQHAVIRRKGNSYVIEDLQSSNGLYIGGIRVVEHVLQHGDEIQIGDFVLRFSV